MTTRKNTSIRLSDGESEALKKIHSSTGTPPAALIQKAVRRYIREYKKIGPGLLGDDPQDPKELEIQGAVKVGGEIISKFADQTNPSQKSRKAKGSA